MAVDNPSYFSLSSGNASTSTTTATATATAATTTTTTTTTTILTSSPSFPSSSRGHGFSALFRRRQNPKMGSNSSASTTSVMIPSQESGRSSTSTSTEERLCILSKNGTPCGNGSSMNQRRSFRNLFRSVSANADHERTQQFLKGDPRPSDVAPPSPYLSHRSHSHSENDHRRPRGRRILKSASELLSNDMVYCALTGDSRQHREDKDDGVNEDDVLQSGGVGGEEDDDDEGGDEDDDDDDDDDEDDEDDGDDDDDEDDNVYVNEDEEENNPENDRESVEVFLGVDDARYYNLSATLPAVPGSASSGRRRHSIGTFLGKERCGRTNIASSPGRRNEKTEAKTMTPSISVDVVDGFRHERKERKERRSCGKSRRRRRRRRRHRSSSGRGTRTATTLPEGNVLEEDVAFVSSKESEAASLWVNYLTACFEQISRQQGRPPFKIRHVPIEESVARSSNEERIKSARLQIVVICPVLLEGISGRAEQTNKLSNLSRLLNTEKVLAMLLGVREEHVQDVHKSTLISYDRWRKFFVKDQDETFVGEFLGAAVGILGSAPPPALRSDKTAFSVHPKKVKLGQSRIIVLLNDPLKTEDSVNVIVDRCGEAIEITHVKRRNPYALQFSVPERCLEVSMLVGVRITKNGSPLGVRQVKCESRLRELDQILRAHDNPLEFMCQTFGFNPGDREQLDNWMVHAFQRNVPPHFNLLSTPSGGLLPANNKNHISAEENPTLLHFAARFGLERLAWQLLECPGGDLACDLRNVSELTPADLAEQAGHARLAHQLRGYMQMNEFTNMYSYLKVISETASTDPASGGAERSTTADSEREEDYCRPRPLSEAYSVPPAARPITTLILPSPTTSAPTNVNHFLEANYSVVPTPTPVAVSPEQSLQGYMKMHAAGPNKSQEPPCRTGTPTQIARQDSQQGNREDSSSFGRTNVKSREPSGPQDELLEIINDFKNNVFTISEVERLVENWRNRNDVQQSFKDKQRQLTAMREEYERIQKRMKEEMKAPTPFDKIKKFFSKGKKDTKEHSNGNEDSTSTKAETTNGSVTDRRPVSSLSLRSVSSSSSSGRMSTVSGCSGTSLGDSGTHSDTEDRRLQRGNREEKVGMTSYEIPPAPKPFAGRYSPGPAVYSSSSRCSTETNEIDSLKRTQPRSEDSEYYVAFPPSGLPVDTPFKAEASREPKTPGSPNEHPRYLDIPKDYDARGVPVPPVPPGGMCIPTNYVNVGKAEETSGVGTEENVKLPEYINVEFDHNGTEEEKKKLPPPPVPPRGKRPNVFLL